MKSLQKLLINVRSRLNPSIQRRRSPSRFARTASSQAEELRLRVALEYLHQSRCSVYLSLVIITAGTIISFKGADMLLSGKTTEAAIAAVANLLSSACHLQLLKDANARLEKSAAVLEDEQ